MKIQNVFIFSHLYGDWKILYIMVYWIDLHGINGSLPRFAVYWGRNKIGQCFSNLRMHQNYLEGWFKSIKRLWGLNPTVCDSAGIRCGVRLWRSKNCSGINDAAGLRSHFANQWNKELQFSIKMSTTLFLLNKFKSWIGLTALHFHIKRNHLLYLGADIIDIPNIH